jgi:hypothetical protein
VGKAEYSGPYHGDVEPGVQCVSRIQAPALSIWETGSTPSTRVEGVRVDQKPAETVK